MLFRSGGVFLSSGAILGEISIWNGAGSYIASQYNVGAGSNWPANCVATAIVTQSAADTYTLKAAANANGATLAANGSYISGFNTYIYAVRLA